MAFLETVQSRIDIKEFADDSVSKEVKRDVLEAARLAPSGRNRQHWRFVLVEDPDRLTELGERSPSGSWVADAAFAVVVATDPRYDYHKIDAGKTITHMQFAAWDQGVGSSMYTVDAQSVKDFVELPEEYHLTAVVGFGYPRKEIQGTKDRKPLDEVAFREKFGNSLDFSE